ncbi:hypothetical protein AGMMS49944_24870 [Spirochaetia bacterium]|nr:hypothetical protein AGMMS49944_24870 [Spirochaetia bacterium]
MFDILAIFRKKNLSPLEKETLLSENQKKEIDATWGLLERRMSDHGCMLLTKHTQPDDLAIALLHSKKQIIEHFERSCTCFVGEGRKYVPYWEKVKLSMKAHKNTTEEDGYRMKSHIINNTKRLTGIMTNGKECDIFRDLVH